MTRLGNFGVDENSRIASRYATLATASGMRNDGSPVRLKLREQNVSDTSKMPPSPYSLCEGVSFTRRASLFSGQHHHTCFLEAIHASWKPRPIKIDIIVNGFFIGNNELARHGIDIFPSLLVLRVFLC